MVTKKQKTATKIMNRKRSAKGSIKRLILAVPELHKVAKQAAEDIYKLSLISMCKTFIILIIHNTFPVYHFIYINNFILTSNKSLTTPVAVLRCPCISQ